MAAIPENSRPDEVVRIVDGVIKSRETKKIIGPVDLDWDHPFDRDDEARRAFDQQIDDSIAAAGWAPFHHSRKTFDVRGADVIHEPWRFYRFDRRACVILLGRLAEISPDAAKQEKLAGYLAATGTLVLVTWLPEAADANADSKVQLRNDEHLAAAAAAVQNLLLSAAARQLETYWNSGGILRNESAFRLIGIPTTEKLLATVFIAPPIDDYGTAVDANPGKLRALRSGPEKWCRSVTMD